MLKNAAALLVAGVAVAGVGYEGWKTLQEIPSQRFPAEKKLSATATAAAKEGLTTTLRPEGPFTERMIQQVINNTGIVILELTNGERILRSAWLAQGPGDGYNIVTALHEAGNGINLTDGRIIKNVLFGRPNIDRNFVAVDANKCKIASGGSKEIPQDVALITIPIENFNFKTNPPDGIPFFDGYIPENNRLVLFDGYPNQFKNPSNLLLSTNYGDIAPVTSASAPYWGVKGLVGLGSSGEPVFAVVNGQLTGVGVIVGDEAFYEVANVWSLPLNALRNSSS